MGGAGRLVRSQVVTLPAAAFVTVLWGIGEGPGCTFAARDAARETGRVPTRREGPPAPLWVVKAPGRPPILHAPGLPMFLARRRGRSLLPGEVRMRSLHSEFLALTSILALAPALAAAAPVTLTVTAGGTTAVRGSAPGSAALDTAERDPAVLNDKDAGFAPATPGAAAVRGVAINRRISQGWTGLRGEVWEGRERHERGPELALSFHGLDHFATRTANGGNQFSTEPPDQGLCAGNGFVLETVNQVLRVFDTRGNPLTAPIDLNSFYGYPAAIDRAASPRTFGPDLFDPSCYFDQATQRWFHLVSTLERVSPTSSSLSGQSHIDLAVSTTSSPLGSWIVYRINAEDDGTNGTPNHGCALDAQGTPGPCFPDFPHIGANDDGIFITTNEFDFFGPNFHGAEIYALSKRALARGDATVNVVLLDTADPSLGVSFDGVAGFPGFTVWPAQSASRGELDDGTEFFVSSQAVFNDVEADNRLRLWSVSGTGTLHSKNPRLKLAARTVDVLDYSVAPESTQKAGDTPLLDCLNDTTLDVGTGVPGCWQLLVTGGPFHEVEGPLDSNDTRVQQVYAADGLLFTALDTAATVGGMDRAAIAWFVLDPHHAQVVNQGVLADKAANITYPTVAVTASGRGVMGFTLVGPDAFPSAAYASIDARSGAGDIHLAAAGVGPQDGFTEYHAFGPPFRPRWGDYGAAAADGRSVWIASEYIGQTCTFEEYLATGFTCGNTRTALANWGTRVSQVIP